jgi:hypothetical protein
MMPGGKTSPGGKPVIAVPGQTPKFPLTSDAPVLVTVEPPRTAKLPATPSPGAMAAKTSIDRPANARVITRMIEIDRYFSLRISSGLFQKSPTNGYSVVYEKA